MFTKQDAIQYIKQIQSGNFNRYDPDIPRGEVAADLWEDSKFGYGMENGAILALMKAFDISLSDMGYSVDYQPNEPRLSVPISYSTS